MISKIEDRVSLGLLSRDHLSKSTEDEPDTPLATWRVSQSPKKTCLKALKEIVEWSPFKSVDKLVEMANGMGKKGTMLILFDLEPSSDGKSFELDFSNPHDISLSEKAVIILLYFYNIYKL